LCTHDRVVVARLTVLDDTERPSWVALAGRSFFWDEDTKTYLELPP
jgi:hypothetical protein